MSRKSCGLVRSRFWQPINCFEHFFEWLGFRQECCRTRRSSTRLWLDRFEERLAPALALDAFDPMGCVNRTIWVQILGAGGDSGYIAWGDGNKTGVSWTIGSGPSIVKAPHVYLSAATVDVQLQDSSGLDITGQKGQIRIIEDLPPDFVCTVPQICGEPEVDPLIKAWEDCDNYIDPGMSIKTEPFTGDPGFSLPTRPGDRKVDPGINAGPPVNCPPTGGLQPNQFSEGPIRYADGVIRLAIDDLSSSGFGMTWGQSRSWTNGPGYDRSGDLGPGWVETAFPSLLSVDSKQKTLVAISTGTSARYFDETTTAGVYQERHFGLNILKAVGGGYELVTQSQMKFVFSGFSGAAEAQGQLVSMTDPNGNTTTVTRFDSKATYPDYISSVTRSMKSGTDTVQEEFVRSYLKLGDGSIRLDTETLQRSLNGGTAQVVRSVDYDFYADGESNGNLGQLKLATIKDGAGVSHPETASLLKLECA